jgi:preprotein translocase subunit SecG
MNILVTLILAVQILSAVVMVGLILIQHGKGADMGAAFGSGGSGSLFGASGSANFLSRTTGVLAGVFFVCTLALAYFGNLRPSGAGSVLEGAGAIAPPATAASAAVQPASGAGAGLAGAIPGAGPAGSTVSGVPASAASVAPAATASAAVTPKPAASPAKGADQIPSK